MLWLLGALALSAPAGPPPALLAPGPADLEAVVGELELRVQRAEAISRAARRVHNRWAEVLLSQPRPPCEDADAASLAARSGPLVEALTSRAQSARAQWGRVELLTGARSLSEVLDPQATARVEDLRARVADLERGYGELVAWQREMVDPWARGCRPALQAAPGLPDPGPRAQGERSRVVAAVAMPGGLICPRGEEGTGGVVLLEEGACYSSGAACDCAPAPVLPGAVLGPGQAEEKSGSAR
jgi:hypothetical protein